MKLKYIKVAADSPELHGLPDVDIIEGFLFDPDWAVPKMASRYANNIRLARQLYPNEDIRGTATGFYKAGVRGFRDAYADKSSVAWQAVSRHIQRVQTHFNWFKKVLAE